MTALRQQLSAYGPNVVNIGLPPKQPHSVAAASAPAQPPRVAPVVRFPRERILLGRWRRRARQRLLQSHAGRVGRLVRVHVCTLAGSAQGTPRTFSRGGRLDAWGATDLHLDYARLRARRHLQSGCRKGAGRARGGSRMTQRWYKGLCRQGGTRSESGVGAERMQGGCGTALPARAPLRRPRRGAPPLSQTAWPRPPRAAAARALRPCHRWWR